MSNNAPPTEEVRRGLSTHDKDELQRAWKDKGLSALIDYIESHYHNPLKKTIPSVVALLGKAQERLATKGREVLTPLRTLARRLTEDLENHLRDEEDCFGTRVRINDEHNQIVDHLVRVQAQDTLRRLRRICGGQCRPADVGRALRPDTPC